ncbi:hypothetical protein ACR2XN_28525 [Klebsiella pneumoniae]
MREHPSTSRKENDHGDITADRSAIMSGYKDGNTKIPMLKRNEYTHWEVKMLHHLEAIDPDYIDRIRDGPYVPTKLISAATVDGKVVDEHNAEKPKSDWTKE